ncbi:hypothetical protein Nepgr_003303 [Nepenthes gracilis]|uniref:Uncharacterized protein n=1 Tax=Nepenthes gracilis TaxID=150966 RepID=A0AAD3RZ83_NEPGR|nr:hypothetical protein Nepgr_003303 [Nepenthes gracilis]
MPAAAAAVAAALLQSSFLCSAKKPSTQSSSNPNTTPRSAIEPKSLLQKHPLYSHTQTNLSLPFKEKILCLEILGIDSGKALSLNPSLHTASLQAIHNILSYLQSKGIHQKDFPRIVGMCPQLITSDIKTDLNPVFNFLSQELRVPQQSFRRVVNKCPRLLISSVRDQLKPALFYLQRLGFRDLEALAYNDPILLVSSVEKTLIPKLDYLVSLGFTKGEAVGMVLRCPSLFTFSIENNFKPKVEFFVGEMKGSLEELKDFPQYFAFSLEKRIKPRYVEVVRSGVDVPLSVMLKSTDDEFWELLKQGTGMPHAA